MSCPFGETASLLVDCGRHVLAERLPVIVINVTMKRLSATVNATVPPTIASGSVFPAPISAVVLNESGDRDDNSKSRCEIVGSLIAEPNVRVLLA